MIIAANVLAMINVSDLRSIDLKNLFGRIMIADGTITWMNNTKQLTNMSLGMINITTNKNYADIM